MFAWFVVLVTVDCGFAIAIWLVVWFVFYLGFGGYFGGVCLLLYLDLLVVVCRTLWVCVCRWFIVVFAGYFWWFWICLISIPVRLLELIVRVC